MKNSVAYKKKSVYENKNEKLFIEKFKMHFKEYKVFKLKIKQEADSFKISANTLHMLRKN